METENIIIKETKGTTIVTDNNQIVVPENDFLKKFNLDFEVTKKRYHYSFNGKLQSSSNFAIIRKDNGKELGNCKSRYTVRQNSEIFETLQEICKDSNYSFKKAGIIGSGEKVYFFIQNPINLKIGDDEIERFIFALSTHDGSGNLAFGYSTNVMSCRNQFNRFYRSSSLRIKHTLSSRKKLDKVPDAFKEHLVIQSITDNAFQKFAEIDDKSTVKSLAKDLVDELMQTNKVPVKDLSTRKLNMINELKSSINHEIKAKGYNLWGLFNGITYYVNNKKLVKKEPNDKIKSLYDYNSNGYKLQNKAFEWLCEKNNIDY